MTQFREFWQPLGCYSSCLLPRQDGGTSQIQVNGRLLPSRCVTLYLRCCKDKEPKGEICIIGDVGNEMCASGNCGERFPWWFMLIYPPSAISM